MDPRQRLSGLQWTCPRGEGVCGWLVWYRAGEVYPSSDAEQYMYVPRLGRGRGSIPQGRALPLRGGSTPRPRSANTKFARHACHMRAFSLPERVHLSLPLRVLHGAQGGSTLLLTQTRECAHALHVRISPDVCSAHFTSSSPGPIGLLRLLHMGHQGGALGHAWLWRLTLL